MKEIIENLKDKNYVRAFGLMSPEEQECYREARKDSVDNVLVYTGGTNWEKLRGKGISEGSTYAIKPDYQPGPEYVDLEIKQRGNPRALGVYWVHDQHWTASILPHSFTHLYCLLSLPNFEKFYDGNKADEPSMCVTDVADRMSKDNKVYARLRK